MKYFIKCTTPFVSSTRVTVSNFQLVVRVYQRTYEGSPARRR